MANEADVAGPTVAGPRFSRWGLWAYALSAAVVVLDQVSKGWVVGLIEKNHGPVVLAPIFRLTLVENAGISFGLFHADTPSGRWILVLLALAIVVALAVWVRRMSRPMTALALGFVIGGAIGNNLIDRVRFGAVVDFLDFHPLFPWVFNVADVAINIGVALLLLDSFLGSKSEGAA
jgi:signal peptidase II